MLDFVVKFISSLVSKFVGDNISSRTKVRKAEKKLRGYIEHLLIDIDNVTIFAFELWDISYKRTYFELTFEEPSKFVIPRDFENERIQGYLNECADSLNETLRVTVTALLRHIGNYNVLKKEVSALKYDFDEQKSYKLYIESLYVRRYIIALANDWDKVILLTLENHTHEQLVSPLGLPVNTNSLRARVFNELNARK
jgi:hypothetical protein